MIHRRAARLLPSVLDHTLAAPLEAAVRAHIEDCERCVDALLELETAEVLLRRLPLAGGWTRARDLPAPGGQTFMSAWRRRQMAADD